MDERRFDQDLELDSLLTESLSAPPEDILREVTPWRRAMKRILVGLVLGTLTLNSWNLNYILPAAGHVLTLLGLRVLRRENGFFRFWWHSFLINTGLYVFRLLRLAAPGWADFYRTPSGMALTGLGLAFQLIQLFCLWQGLRAVRRRAGLSPGAGSGFALLVFNCFILLLASIGLSQIGWFFFIGMLIAYICIIRGLVKLSRELDEAGYTIQPVPVRIPDRVLALGLSGAVLAGIAAVGLTCSRLPMDWQPVDSAEHSQTSGLEAELLELGFPETVLADLSRSDILACEGALRVVVDRSDDSLTAFRDDPARLHFTHVAVELAGEQEKWRIFHHFSGEEGTAFYGTEAFQLWTPYDHMSEGWSRSAAPSGRVLFDRDGTSFWSPYYSLGTETYTADSIFFGTQTSSNPMASFSFPYRGERCRGYVTYETAEIQDGWIMFSWINYVHQRTWLSYPAMTAREWQMTGAWNGDDQPFFRVQTAIQFYPWTVDEKGAV